MKSFQLVLNIFLVIVVACNAQTADYCNKNLCLYSPEKNIACNNSGEFPSFCPAGTKLMEMTEAFKELIVNYHNAKRDLIASGLGNFTASKRMATMQWDNELADLAGLNLKRFACNYSMVHDQCHNTDRFLYSGQNLANMRWSGGQYPTDMILNICLKLWFDENNVCTQSILDQYPDNYRGPVVGHFTVMVSDKNTRVGCSMITLQKDGIFYFFFACNYAQTNIIRFPIYKKSLNGPATGCSATNPKYPHLCSVNENIDPNAIFD